MDRILCLVSQCIVHGDLKHTEQHEQTRKVFFYRTYNRRSSDRGARGGVGARGALFSVATSTTADNTTMKRYYLKIGPTTADKIARTSDHCVAMSAVCSAAAVYLAAVTAVATVQAVG